MCEAAVISTPSCVARRSWRPRARHVRAQRLRRPLVFNAVRRVRLRASRPRQTIKSVATQGVAAGSDNSHRRGVGPAKARTCLLWLAVLGWCAAGGPPARRELPTLPQRHRIGYAPDAPARREPAISWRRPATRRRQRSAPRSTAEAASWPAHAARVCFLEQPSHTVEAGARISGKPDALQHRTAGAFATHLRTLNVSIKSP